MAGKARVHELAKELGVTSKEVLAKLSDLGEFVKSASSTVEAPVARINRFVSIAAELGRHSYSIYLWHLPFIAVAVPVLMKIFRLSPNAAVEGLLYVVGSAACGVAAAKIIEFPALAVRDRYFPARDVAEQTRPRNEEGCRSPSIAAGEACFESLPIVHAN